jgi:lipopolysaccharide biosynthesis glycosyltransferase
MGAAQKVELLMCADDTYAQHLTVCLASLLANNPTILIELCIAGEINKTNKDNILQIRNQFENIIIRFENVNRDKLEHLPRRDTLTRYARHLISDFYGPSVQKVLYLDCDIVVTGDIAGLWQTDLSDYLLAAVPIPWFDRDHVPGFPEDTPYVNSGVILFNLERWRTEDNERRIFDYIDKHRDVLRDRDQDALNGCFHGSILYLDYKWNVINPYFRRQPCAALSEGDFARILSDARLIHFNGGRKPWHYVSNHPRKGEYYKYLALTAWKGYVPPDRTLGAICSKMLVAATPDGLRRRIKSMLNPASRRRV